ncbi:MAG: hypothetical protein M1836_000427 [Candelina mexicana]|nr:MAG: hypothetical protein M1836_000427 [Candelina mexicana]
METCYGSLSADNVMTDYLIVLLQSLSHLKFDHAQISADAFARFWIFFSRDPPPSSDALTSILSTATGTVLELGPGSGGQVKYLTNPSTQAIYGAEPCEGLHKALRKSVADAGLGDKYHVLGCGGEIGSLVPGLAKAGLLRDGETSEVFDSIVCVRVLCSVPNIEETVKGLYALLKPGGRIIICEHVVNPGGEMSSTLARILQGVYMLMGWKIFLGGCHLDRDTLGALQKAGGSGGWERVKIEMQSEWSTIPHALGVLVKKGS